MSDTHNATIVVELLLSEHPVSQAVRVLRKLADDIERAGDLPLFDKLHDGGAHVGYAFDADGANKTCPDVAPVGLGWACSLRQGHDGPHFYGRELK